MTSINFISHDLWFDTVGIRTLHLTEAFALFNHKLEDVAEAVRVLATFPCEEVMSSKPERVKPMTYNIDALRCLAYY